MGPEGDLEEGGPLEQVANDSVTLNQQRIIASVPVERFDGNSIFGSFGLSFFVVGSSRELDRGRNEQEANLVSVTSKEKCRYFESRGKSDLSFEPPLLFH